MNVKITDLRQKLPSYLRRVQRGERILVTSRGQVIAELAPPAAAPDQAADARKRLRRSVLSYAQPLEPADSEGSWSAYR
jgi:antitoxin (DNA-binding transcriptional repressor) of toxin-antitoxin stability system